ncbi:MAG: acyl-CoA dehydrogenase family protein [Alphaproteobacteria bacterium]
MDYPPETRGENFYRLDVNLQRALKRIAPETAARDDQRLTAFGAWVGTDVDAQAEYTSRFAPPVLATYDRDGETANRVEHNPRYAAVHRDVYRRGIVGLNYEAEARPFLTTFVMGYLLSQADISIHCPVTLTGAVAYVLDRYAPQVVKAGYLKELTRMDGNAMTGATWATERDCGSDLAATTTAARATAGGFTLSGLKWFASNADCDLALATARPEGAPGGSKGLGLYLVPRRLGDGGLNSYRIRRLKDKLGTRGLATGEIDLLDAEAFEVAGPPNGLKIMMEALGFSRIHNAVAAAGAQRRAFLEAAGHVYRRQAFGRRLADYTMIQDLLLDVLMQVEAGLALALEAASAFDAAEQTDEPARVWQRTATALAKHQTAEQAVAAASRAIEILGGNGYTEEFVTARLLRDAQVLTVWEGPGNIQALELLRLLGEKFGAFEAFDRRIDALLAPCDGAAAELAAPVRRARDACRAAVGHVHKTPDEGPRLARRILDLMADTLAAALLLDEAAADLKRGDARKALIARRFIEARLALPDHHRVEARDSWPYRLFHRIAGYQPIEPRDAFAA